MNRTLELKQQLGAAVDKAAVLVEKARTEKRAMSTEEDTSYQAIMTEVNGLRTTIKNEESLAGLQASLKDGREHRQDETGVDADEQRAFFRRFLLSTRGDKPVHDHEWKELNEKQAKRFHAFAQFLRYGPGQLTAEERASLGDSRMEAVRGDIARTDIERRAAQSDVTGNLGAYTVPQGFLAELQIALKYYSGMLEVGPRIITTESGNDMPMPMTDDTANVGRRLSENTPVTNTAVPFGQKTLKAWKYSSDLLLIPVELLQDTGIDLEAELITLLATRIGRKYNSDFTTNNDGNGPSGVTIDATLGVTSTTGHTGLPQYADIVGLKYSVNRAYRNGAKWMMNDTTLAGILKLVDGNQRPLILDYLTTLQEDEPEKLLGQPIVINNDMADPGTAGSPVTGNICMLYGAWKNYWVRMVRDFTLLRLVERYADAFQVGMVGFSRADGRLVDAGQHPIKYLQSATS